MSIINALIKIEHFPPRYSPIVLYRACVLPVLDYGDIMYDNCTTADCNLLESVQTAPAKLILGCLRTKSQEMILKELGLTPLFVRRQVHILLAFRTTLFGPCPFLHIRPCSQIFKKSFRLLHVFIWMFSWPPVKLIPYIILFSIRLETLELFTHCPS